MAHEAMIATSTINAKNSVGNVTFGGCAARFNANTGTLQAHAIIQNVKLLLAKNTMDSNVRGNTMPMSPNKLKPSHKKRLSSCLLHQLKNLLKKPAFAVLLSA